VTIIGSTAFNGNLLTSVIIPNSVTIIRANSFSANLLSSLTLGSSVSTIGDSAFGGNQLTSVAIPDSVTTIDPMAFVGNSSLDVNTTEPMFLSGDPVQVQQVYDSIRLVHLFTVNSSNPNNLQDSVVTEAVLVGMDLNGNGNQNDVLGGHLINPADAENDVLTSSGGSVSGLASTGQNTVPMAVVSIILVTISSCFLMYTRRKQW
ncbi:leucine-rich repeat domain-containing protein, partial [Candidatus Saccharibacteria bacterium]|nr:leucine-rich repeat domain-containing protein [Candidatus Saccharibacteria bacterium]